MNRRPRRVATRLLALALTVSLVVAPAVAVAQEAGARLRAVDAESYPNVTLTVVLPADAFDPTGPVPGFTVEENGRKAEVAQVEPLGRARGPIDVVLVVDVSGSMEGDALANAKSAARSFVSALADSDSVALVEFSSSARLAAGFSQDRGVTDVALAGLEAAGNTSLYDAVEMAAGLLAQRSADTPRSIVVLADGADDSSAGTFDDAVRTATAAGASVYSVSLETADFDPAPLETLAEATGGRAFSVEDSDQLSDRFQAIAAEMQNLYAITYVSGEPSTIELELDITATLGEQTTTLQTAIANPRFSDPANVQETVEEYRVAARTDPVMLLATVILLFAAIAAGVIAIALLVARTRTGLDQLEFYDQLHARPTDAADAAGGDDSVRGRMIEAVGWVAGKRGFTEVLHLKLEQAGMPLRSLEYIYLHVVAVIGIGFVAQLLTGSLVTSIVLVLVAVAAPLIALEYAIEKRRRAFEEQLPEILSLIAGSIRSGWGLLQSLDLVVQESVPPASVEFRRVEAEARLGLPLDQALEKMAARIGSEDFRWTVVAINIQREVGGNLAEVLDILSQTMRDRAELRRHIRALTAEGRLSAVILYALPFMAVFALSVVNPSYLADMFSHPFGIGMLAMGLALLGVGGVWLWRVSKVEI